MKGAVFDWDQTLANIDDREFYCINHALTENGSTPINNEFYIKNYYLRAYEEGTGPRMVMETALAGKSRAAIETVYESYWRVFQATADKANHQTGAIEILKALKRTGFCDGMTTMRQTRSVVEYDLKT